MLKVSKMCRKKQSEYQIKSDQKTHGYDPFLPVEWIIFWSLELLFTEQFCQLVVEGGLFIQSLVYSSQTFSNCE